MIEASFAIYIGSAVVLLVCATLQFVAYVRWSNLRDKVEGLRLQYLKALEDLHNDMPAAMQIARKQREEAALRELEDRVRAKLGMRGQAAPEFALVLVSLTLLAMLAFPALAGGVSSLVNGNQTRWTTSQVNQCPSSGPCIPTCTHAPGYDGPEEACLPPPGWSGPTEMP